MVDFGTLFWLILAALTLIIACLFFIVYLIIEGEREKNKLKAKERSATEKETTQECLHFFGYLVGYPKNQPIPNECFGCMKAIKCINKDKMENIAEVEEAPQR